MKDNTIGLGSIVADTHVATSMAANGLSGQPILSRVLRIAMINTNARTKTSTVARTSLHLAVVIVGRTAKRVLYVMFPMEGQPT